MGCAISAAVATQLLLVRISKSLFLDIRILTFCSVLLIFKLISSRNHFLNYLISIEVLIVIAYASMLYEVRCLSSSRALLFLLIVVIGGCMCRDVTTGSGDSNDK